MIESSEFAGFMILLEAFIRPLPPAASWRRRTILLPACNPYPESQHFAGSAENWARRRRDSDFGLGCARAPFQSCLPHPQLPTVIDHPRLFDSGNGVRLRRNCFALPQVERLP